MNATKKASRKRKRRKRINAEKKGVEKEADPREKREKEKQPRVPIKLNRTQRQIVRKLGLKEEQVTLPQKKPKGN